MLRFGSDVKTWLALTGEATAERVADVGFDDRTWQILALKIRRRKLLGSRIVALEGPFVPIAGGDALVLLPGSNLSMVTSEVMAGLRTPPEGEAPLRVGAFESPGSDAYTHLRWMDDLSQFCLQSMAGELGLIEDFVVRDDPPSLEAFVVEHLNGSHGKRRLIFAGQVQRIDDQGRKIWYDAAPPRTVEPVRDHSPGAAGIRDEGLRDVAAGLRWSGGNPGDHGRRAMAHRIRFVKRFLYARDDVRH